MCWYSILLEEQIENSEIIVNESNGPATEAKSNRSKISIFKYLFVGRDDIFQNSINTRMKIKSAIHLTAEMSYSKSI